MNMISINTTCIIIVTYNPDTHDLSSKLSTNFGNLTICIVDNSTIPTIQQSIKNFESLRINVITNNGNIGIAKAQNIGINWAFSENFESIITLDQDSKLDDKIIKKLIERYNFLIESFKVACVGPFPLNTSNNSWSTNKHILNREKTVEVDVTLSSGMLISKETLQNVGQMDEDLFIDLVDWEWCWRAKREGYSTFVCNDLIMPHKLGEGRLKLMFGLDFGIPNPFRHYYQFRNYILMLPRKYVPIKFKIKYFFINCFKLIAILFFLKPRITRIRFALKGMIDGIYYIMQKN